MSRKTSHMDSNIAPEQRFPQFEHDLDEVIQSEPRSNLHGSMFAQPIPFTVDTACFELGGDELSDGFIDNLIFEATQTSGTIKLLCQSLLQLQQDLSAQKRLLVQQAEEASIKSNSQQKIIENLREQVGRNSQSQNKVETDADTGTVPNATDQESSGLELQMAKQKIATLESQLQKIEFLHGQDVEVLNLEIVNLKKQFSTSLAKVERTYLRKIHSLEKQIKKISSGTYCKSDDDDDDHNIIQPANHVTSLNQSDLYFSELVTPNTFVNESDTPIGFEQFSSEVQKRGTAGQSPNVRQKATQRQQTADSSLSIPFHLPDDENEIESQVFRQNTTETGTKVEKNKKAEVKITSLQFSSSLSDDSSMFGIGIGIGNRKSTPNRPKVQFSTVHTSTYHEPDTTLSDLHNLTNQMNSFTTSSNLSAQHTRDLSYTLPKPNIESFIETTANESDSLFGPRSATTSHTKLGVVHVTPNAKRKGFSQNEAKDMTAAMVRPFDFDNDNDLDPMTAPKTHPLNVAKNGIDESVTSDFEDFYVGATMLATAGMSPRAPRRKSHLTSMSTSSASKDAHPEQIHTSDILSVNKPSTSTNHHSLFADLSQDLSDVENMKKNGTQAEGQGEGEESNDHLNEAFDGETGDIIDIELDQEQGSHYSDGSAHSTDAVVEQGGEPSEQVVDPINMAFDFGSDNEEDIDQLMVSEPEQ